MREGASPRKFAARVPHADFVDIVDGNGGALAPLARKSHPGGKKIRKEGRFIFLRTRIDIIDKCGQAALCKAFRGPDCR